MTKVTDISSAKTFAKGTTVKIKSGSPTMVVVAPRPGDNAKGDDIVAIWMSNTGIIREKIPFDALIKTEPPQPPKILHVQGPEDIEMLLKDGAAKLMSEFASDTPESLAPVPDKNDEGSRFLVKVGDKYLFDMTLVDDLSAADLYLDQDVAQAIADTFRKRQKPDEQIFVTVHPVYLELMEPLD